MEAVLFQIVRALATVFEITLAFALLNAMFEPKYASKWPLRLSYILLLAAVFSSSARAAAWAYGPPEPIAIKSFSG